MNSLFQVNAACGFRLRRFRPHRKCEPHSLCTASKHTVVFCGEGHFNTGYRYTKEALSDCSDISVIQSSGRRLEEALRTAAVIVPYMTKIGHQQLQGAPMLKLIMQFGVGLETVDIACATSIGVPVCKIPSEGTGNAESCAEHSIYLALSLMRNRKEMDISVSCGRLGTPSGKTLYKSNVVVYGYGGIGKALAKRLAAFEVESMNLIVRKSTLHSDRRVEFDRFLGEAGAVRTVLPTTRFSEAAKTADVVFLCCNQNESNIGLVDKQFIDALKPGCILVNVARGGLLNYADVYAALERGQIGGLGMDVYHTEPFPVAAHSTEDRSKNPLLHHPRVVVTPHVAGVTEVSYRNMAKVLAENVRRVLLLGENPLYAVNQV